ncbi:hypothetical protein L226DRAFT_567278 [Lentinus tigrinus ALCF2SS1-7]|uniref:Uncharacterized protein n=1 Tax=Lentinus tigrinus ALCF2SS1-6 TaxID=1328759 RepID=A0A5C2SQ89_9APHY|nr:hypothetical protein L227DRAFT_213947 [Lentinus tigrinus ALCF2SS1-6]RPD79091.1 hypothetical protein L226DRAFT_567278 [Lentinus tigrinus ALCF2SS1-7]
MIVPLNLDPHLTAIGILAAGFINFMPTEILVEIFLALAASPSDDDDEYDSEDEEEDDDEDDSWQKTKGCVQWLVVTEVCHRWYNVAVNTPMLWQVIDVYSNLGWLKLCLERSGTAPLDVRFHDMDTAKEAGDLVVPHASRISKLSVLPRQGQSAWCSLHYLKGVPMPLLKEFHSPGDSAVHVNQGDHPSLEVLRARESDIDWKKIPYEHLRVLDLETCTPRYKNRLTSLDAFLGILESFQRLEELNLNFSIPLDTFIFGDEQAINAYWKSSRIVSLPLLRKLGLTSGHSSHRPSDVCAMLSRMKLAPTTSVSIWMGLEDLENFHGLHGLLPRDSDTFPFLTHATSASCMSHGVEILIFTVKCDNWATLSVRYEMCAGGYMKDAYPPDAALSDFNAVFSRAPLTHITLNCDAGKETLVQTFQTFPLLRGLTVSMGGRQSTFDHFLSSFRSPGYDGRGPVLPALCKLRLSESPWRDTMLGCIATCLGARMACGAGKLSTLDIEVAPKKGVPDDEDLEDMLDDLEPFMKESWGVMCYVGYD